MHTKTEELAASRLAPADEPQEAGAEAPVVWCDCKPGQCKGQEGYAVGTCAIGMDSRRLVRPAAPVASSGTAARLAPVAGCERCADSPNSGACLTHEMAGAAPPKPSDSAAAEPFTEPWTELELQEARERVKAYRAETTEPDYCTLAIKLFAQIARRDNQIATMGAQLEASQNRLTQVEGALHEERQRVQTRDADLAAMREPADVLERRWLDNHPRPKGFAFDSPEGQYAIALEDRVRWLCTGVACNQMDRAGMLNRAETFEAERDKAIARADALHTAFELEIRENAKGEDGYYCDLTEEEVRDRMQQRLADAALSQSSERAADGKAGHAASQSLQREIELRPNLKAEIERRVQEGIRNTANRRNRG